MKDVVESLLALVPFLQRYPAWVKVVFVIWLLSTVALVTALVFAKTSAQSSEDQARADQSATVSGATNSNVYQAGRDIIIGEPSWQTRVADSSSPLTIQASVYPGAPYPPGTKLGGIEWQDRFCDVRLNIGNRSDLDAEEIDFLFQTDESIEGVGQLGNIPNLVVSPQGNMPPMWLEGQDEHGNPTSVPVVPSGDAIAPTWRISLPKLLRGSELNIVIAAVSLNPTINGQLPQKLFAPRRLPSWIRIAGRYQTSSSRPPTRYKLQPTTIALK